VRELVEWVRVLAMTWLVTWLLEAPRRRREEQRRFRWALYESMRAAHPDWQLEQNPYVWRWWLTGA
jgi:hypothetical protein